VIEFQNSLISSEELEQREAFYGDIIWVVTDEKFEKNFHILNQLPDPKSYLVEDVVFFPRRYNHQGKCFFGDLRIPKTQRWFYFMEHMKYRMK
jgi:hypothetical protein